MASDLENLRGQKEQEHVVQQEGELWPWLQDTWKTGDLSRARELPESRSTIPIVHGEVLQNEFSHSPKRISSVFRAIGAAEQQDNVADESWEKIPENPCLRVPKNSPTDVVGTGAAFASEQHQSSEGTAPSIGWGHMSVVTDSQGDGDSDPGPVLSVCVRLDEETPIGFAFVPDTGAQLNVLAERILVEHLGFSIKDLAPNDLKGKLKGVSKDKEPIEVLGRAKMTFYVEGRQDPIKAMFYVIPSNYLTFCDGLLSARLVEKHHLLELSRVEWESPQAASCASTGELTEMALQQIRV